MVIRLGLSVRDSIPPTTKKDGILFKKRIEYLRQSVSMDRTRRCEMGAVKEEWLNNIPTEEDLDVYYQFYLTEKYGRKQDETENEELYRRGIKAVNR